MTNAQPPDAMKKLVLIIIGIAILGTIIALAVHFGMEQPAQQAQQAPKNWETPAQRDAIFTCKNNCIYSCGRAYPSGTPEFNNCLTECQNKCD
jgi:hypothetical protein